MFKSKWSKGSSNKIQFQPQVWYQVLLLYDILSRYLFGYDGDDGRARGGAAVTRHPHHIRHIRDENATDANQ
jgi:hypothetical protein